MDYFLAYRFFPVGLFLMWKYSDWKKIVKLIISLFFSFGVVMSSFSSENLKPKKRRKQELRQKPGQKKRHWQEPRQKRH